MVDQRREAYLARIPKNRFMETTTFVRTKGVTLAADPYVDPHNPKYVLFPIYIEQGSGYEKLLSLEESFSGVSNDSRTRIMGRDP